MELGKKVEIKYSRENSEKAVVNSGIKGFLNNYIHIILLIIGPLITIRFSFILFNRLKK